MKRRDILKSATAFAALGSLPGAALAQQDATRAFGPPMPAGDFGFESVAGIAQDLASAAYVAPGSTLRGAFKDLNYDQYRAIRFRKDRDPWAGSKDFGLDLLPPGLIFWEQVYINIVNNGRVQKMIFSPDYFDIDPALFPNGTETPDVGDMSWSGFRLRAPLNRPDVMDEIAVFQGASYFRAVSRGTLYGLSARGLAIGTGTAEGEEFPVFKEFWIHTPQPGATGVKVHAILDSRSIAGAFEFIIRPGAETLIRTRAALFPRKAVTSLGIAPLTSMYWFGPGDRNNIDDFRPAVHDSDGLQMVTGNETRLWRALNNPAKLQVSAFQDNNPHGFGLTQRERRFDEYQDTEAHYERRPSAWIQPRGDWGRGSVNLIEIPVENEFNDNIVSFWQPREPLEPGKRHEFDYDLTFAALPPDSAPVARVMATRSGMSVNDPKTKRSYVIEFDATIFDGFDPVPAIEASAGTVSGTHIIRQPLENRLRLAFQFAPEGAKLSDISAKLTNEQGFTLSEVWLTRWTEG